MKNNFELQIMGKGLERKLMIQEISSEELESKSSLGSAYGVSIFHCVYLGNNHCLNFLDRVKYYRIDEEAINLKDYRKVHPDGICVEFYG